MALRIFQTNFCYASIHKYKSFESTAQLLYKITNFTIYNANIRATETFLGEVDEPENNYFTRRFMQITFETSQKNVLAIGFFFSFA